MFFSPALCNISFVCFGFFPPAEHVRTRRGGAGGGAKGLHRWRRLQVWTDQDEVRHGRLPGEDTFR